MAVDIGRRAGLAVDNAQLFGKEHEVAVALQRSMLPRVPPVPGLEISAHYFAGSERADVGGDWYDVLPLPDGSVGVAVGDVMGHDLIAAAAMGQLRSVLRSYAWEGHRPSEVLERLDRLVQGLGMAQLATCVYGRLLPVEGGALLRYANAGHLPPVVQRRDRRGRGARRRQVGAHRRAGRLVGGRPAGRQRVHPARRDADPLHRRAGRGPGDRRGRRCRPALRARRRRTTRRSASRRCATGCSTSCSPARAPTTPR